MQVFDAHSELLLACLGTSTVHYRPIEEAFKICFQLTTVVIGSALVSVVSRIPPSQPAPVYHTHNLHLSVTLTTRT